MKQSHPWQETTEHTHCVHALIVATLFNAHIFPYILMNTDVSTELFFTTAPTDLNSIIIVCWEEGLAADKRN